MKRLDEKLRIARIMLERLREGPNEVDATIEDGRQGVSLAVEGPGDNQVAALKRVHIPPGTRGIPDHGERP